MRPETGAGNPARPITYNRSISEGTTRPNSLFPPERPLQPEKQPLKFDVNLVGAPPEVEQLVNNIKQVAEEFLYHWKTFPIGTHYQFYEILPNLLHFHDITESLLIGTFINYLCICTQFQCCRLLWV